VIQSLSEDNAKAINVRFSASPRYNFA